MREGAGVSTTRAPWQWVWQEACKDVRVAGRALYNGLELGGNTWESWANVVRVYCDIFKYGMILLFMIGYERVY
jgi:hypothetical protein